MICVLSWQKKIQTFSALIHRSFGLTWHIFISKPSDGSVRTCLYFQHYWWNEAKTKLSTFDIRQISFRTVSFYSFRPSSNLPASNSWNFEGCCWYQPENHNYFKCLEKKVATNWSSGWCSCTKDWVRRHCHFRVDMPKEGLENLHCFAKCFLLSKVRIPKMQPVCVGRCGQREWLDKVMNQAAELAAEIPNPLSSQSVHHLFRQQSPLTN